MLAAVWIFLPCLSLLPVLLLAAIRYHRLSFRKVLLVGLYVGFIASPLLAVGLLFIASFYPPFLSSPHIFAQRETKNGKFMVAGTTEEFPRWNISLFWKPPGQVWAVYYIDHKGAGWDTFNVIEKGDHLLVQRRNYGDLQVADLNLKTGLKQREPDWPYPPDPPMYLDPQPDPFIDRQVNVESDQPALWSAFQKSLAADRQ